MRTFQCVTSLAALCTSLGMCHLRIIVHFLYFLWTVAVHQVGCIPLPDRLVRFVPYCSRLYAIDGKKNEHPLPCKKLQRNRLVLRTTLNNRMLKGWLLVLLIAHKFRLNAETEEQYCSGCYERSKCNDKTKQHSRAGHQSGPHQGSSLTKLLSIWYAACCMYSGTYMYINKHCEAGNFWLERISRIYHQLWK